MSLFITIKIKGLAVRQRTVGEHTEGHVTDGSGRSRRKEGNTDSCKNLGDPQTG